MATQSAQISSSQGLVDGSSGSNSANDSKCADSFLSSSPVSLIQSPQGERVRQGPGEPADSIATSLRFRSQPSSFTPVSLGFGGEGISHCTKDKQKNMEGHGIESPFSGSSTLVSSAQSNSAGPKSCSGQLWDDTSPIKTSPVSERIKALEALAAKKSETDIWSDGGFLHFKERHYEKSPTETFSPFQKKVSPDQDSPESPFEVLGDPQRGNDFEDTADWMRAHLPPAPNFDAVPELEIKQTAKFLVSECPREIVETPTATVVVASVPYAFMDDPGEMLQQDDPAYEPIKQTSMEEESEFDMSFLPTAYMWDKQDKPDCDSQGLPNIPTLDESKLPPSPPPPAGFGAPTPPPSPPALQLDASAVKPAPWSSDLEPEEIVDLDSSGESDDTVIEDPVSIQAPVTSSPVPDLENPIAIAPSGMCEKEMQSMKQEKPAVLVPIINVIETEDQALSDEEEAEEGFQVIKDVVKAQPKAPSQISELDKSEQHEDSGTEISNFCQQNAPVDESLSKTSSDFETAICKEQSTIDSAAETSFQNQSLNFNIQTENVHSEDFVSQEITRHSFSDEVECSNAAHYQSFTTEIAKTGNQPSLYTESSDQLLEESSGLQSATIDLAKQTSFSDSTNGLAEHPSLNMHSSPVKSNSDFIQEGLPLLGTPTAQLIQEDMNNTEYVSLFGELDGESCPLNIKGTMDMELSSNIQTNVLSSDSGLPNQSELVSLVNAPHNVDGNTTKVATSYGDDPIVTTEDFLPKPVGQPSPQDFTQDPFSDMQNSPQNVDWEMAELQSDRDYLSEMNSPELEKVDIHAIPGSGSGVFAPCESSGLKPVKQEQYNQQEISPPKEPSTETSDPNSFEPECSVSAATDSFVEFMRECLKSRQDEELIDIGSYRTGGEEFPKTAVLSFQSPPGMVLNMEQERLTICALKELGSSQEEDDNLPFEENDSEVTCKEREVPPLTSSSRTSDTFGAPLPALTSESPLQRSATEEVEGIDAWLADAYHLAEHVLTAILTHLSVQDLVYWKDPKKTGMVFGISLLLLLSLAAFSIISVVSYILLALLLVTISFRIYKSVIQAVQKSSEGHPFKALIEKDVSVPPETFRKYVDISLSYINSALKHASRLFLVEDLVDSIKLAVVMWLLTYVGAVFNGITILILADILLFTVPLFYAKNKAQIDHYVGIARNQVNTLVSKLQKKLPGAKPKSE